MSRAVIYARVSNASRSGETHSVDQQVAELRESLERNGHREVHEPLDDRAISGSKVVRRDGWDDLVALVDSGRVDVVALWEISRSTRRMKVWIDFRDLCAERGVKWFVRDHLVDPTDDGDRLTSGVQAIVAEHESSQIAARVRRGIRAKAVEGMPHGREVYGYQRFYDPATRRLVRVEVLTEEAEVVQWLVKGALAKRHLRAMATELNDKGVPSPHDAIALRKHREATGSAWTGRTIKSILVSPTYLGVRRHTPTPRYGSVAGPTAEHEAVWDAIVTIDEHTALVALLTDPARSNRSGITPGVHHFLSGVLRCHKCDGPMRADRIVRTSKTQEVYVCGDSRCRGASIRRADVEDLIEGLVVEWLSQPKASSATATDLVASPEMAARATLDSAEGRLAELADAFASGVLSVAAYGAAEKRLQAQLDEAKQALAASVVPSLPATFDATRPQASWDAADPETRQGVCRALFRTIIVGPTRRGRLPFDPSRVKPEWR